MLGKCFCCHRHTTKVALSTCYRYLERHMPSAWISLGKKVHWHSYHVLRKWLTLNHTVQCKQSCSPWALPLALVSQHYSQCHNKSLRISLKQNMLCSWGTGAPHLIFTPFVNSRKQIKHCAWVHIAQEPDCCAFQTKRTKIAGCAIGGGRQLVHCTHTSG